MYCRNRLCHFFILSSFAMTGLAGAENISGIVYDDANGNNIYDAGEAGVASVAVSNGADVALTGADGRYTLPVEGDANLFVVKPRDWAVPARPGDNIPQYYYLHRPQGSPKTRYEGIAPTGPLPAALDFPLRKQAEGDAFKILCFGDPQPRNVEEVDFLTHDILEPLIGSDAAFGITLGDCVFNNLDVFDPMAQAFGLVGIPWRMVIGNHDHNHDAPSFLQSSETFQRHFGPAYYAFNYGPVHFIALDDVWTEPGKEDYHAELGEKQLTFVANDLRCVGKDQLVVLMMHIPINENKDRAQLFALLQDFPHTFSLSAHTHDQENRFLDAAQEWHGAQPHHHLVHATSCGVWWGGPFGENGIPLTPCGDGTPNGYSVISFNGADYAVEYHAAGFPAEFQMSLSLPDTVKPGEDAALVANVFAGSAKSTVEMQVDGGAWIAMDVFTGKAPNYVQLYERQAKFVAKYAEAKQEEITDKFVDKVRREFRDVLRGLGDPGDTPHLWKGAVPKDLSPGMHLIVVRTRDMFGHEYSARRAFRVAP